MNLLDEIAVLRVQSYPYFTSSCACSLGEVVDFTRVSHGDTWSELPHQVPRTSTETALPVVLHSARGVQETRFTELMFDA